MSFRSVSEPIYQATFFGVLKPLELLGCIFDDVIDHLLNLRDVSFGGVLDLRVGAGIVHVGLPVDLDHTIDAQVNDDGLPAVHPEVQETHF